MQDQSDLILDEAPMRTPEDVEVVSVFKPFKRSFRGGSVVSDAGVKSVIDEIEVQTWNGGTLSLRADASHFITVLNGEMEIDNKGIAAKLRDYCFGTFPGETVISGTGNAVIVSSVNYYGMALFGGPLETDGRLRYVDGCTNSLLLAPPVKGEPCLNFLNLPSGTHQTTHTHPTIRVGMVVSGHGRCGTKADPLIFEEGSVFIIPPDALHSFQTDEANIRIILFHPDSVVGPTDTDQTMLNNTFIEGVSAQNITAIHTTAER
jgi:mannose-6-phosphate isomerase-like protein (cupin superfamily)